MSPASAEDALEAMTNFDEEIHSTEPFEARHTYTFDGDSFSLTVDAALDIVDIDRRSAVEPF